MFGGSARLLEPKNRFLALWEAFALDRSILSSIGRSVQTGACTRTGVNGVPRSRPASGRESLNSVGRRASTSLSVIRVVPETINTTGYVQCSTYCALDPGCSCFRLSSRSYGRLVQHTYSTGDVLELDAAVVGVTAAAGRELAHTNEIRVLTRSGAGSIADQCRGVRPRSSRSSSSTTSTWPTDRV